jgi:hypothetical protein
MQMNELRLSAQQRGNLGMLAEPEHRRARVTGRIFIETGGAGPVN